jgi:hypothetical protein
MRKNAHASDSVVHQQIAKHATYKHIHSCDHQPSTAPARSQDVWGPLIALVRGLGTIGPWFKVAEVSKKGLETLPARAQGAAQNATKCVRRMQDGARQALCDYVNKAGKVLPLFDFPTKGILQEAVQARHRFLLVSSDIACIAGSQSRQLLLRRCRLTWCCCCCCGSRGGAQHAPCVFAQPCTSAHLRKRCADFHQWLCFAETLDALLAVHCSTHAAALCTCAAAMQPSDSWDFHVPGRAQGQLWRLADKDRKPPGLLGWWPAGAVTFLDNHDTGAQSS